MNNTIAYWLHTLTPTHIGTGRGVGYIDLPIHREKITGWPLIPGSAFKGVWAEYYDATDENRRKDTNLRLAFGRASDQDQAPSNAGALNPTDARLICLPVRSFCGTFAWVTSTLVLKMLSRDLAWAGFSRLPSIPDEPVEGKALTPENSKLTVSGIICLEDLDLQADNSKSETQQWAEQLAKWVFPNDPVTPDLKNPWQSIFINRFVIVPEDIFNFLTETGTEVVTRIRIDEDLKTVKQSQLWNEEALPAETILAGIIHCDHVYTNQTEENQKEDLIKSYARDPLSLQIGGKASVGRGRIRCVFTSNEGEG